MNLITYELILGLLLSFTALNSEEQWSKMPYRHKYTSLVIVTYITDAVANISQFIYKNNLPCTQIHNTQIHKVCIIITLKFSSNKATAPSV